MKFINELKLLNLCKKVYFTSLAEFSSRTTILSGKYNNNIHHQTQRQPQQQRFQPGHHRLQQLPDLSDVPDVNPEEKPAIKPQSPQQRANSLIDTWFAPFMKDLECDPTKRVDWNNLDIPVKLTKTPRRVWPMMVLHKLIGVRNQVEGLYENAEALLRMIESEYTAGNLPSNVEMVLSAARIALSVHQKGNCKEALEMYSELCRKNTIDGDLIIDFTTCKVLIGAISKTEKWRDCLKLIEVARLTADAKSTCFSPVVPAALAAGDKDLVDSLLESIYASGEQPTADAFAGILKYETTERLVEILNKYCWVISEDVVEVFKKHFQKSSVIKTVNLFQRNCSCCGNQLLSSQKIPRAEMDQLVEAFDAKVFVRRNDVFLTSTPEENDRFRDFLSARPKHDVVIDALNVIYLIAGSSAANKDEVMANFIKFFARENKNVLILSRKHTKKSLSKVANYLGPEQKVEFFYADDRSQDDLFLLYAGLHGNDGCIIVTKDQLRDHRFLLGSELSKTFKRWQEKHQVTFHGYSARAQTFAFKWPPRHETAAQVASDGTLHIPYQDKEHVVDSYTNSNSWLCIRNIQDMIGKAG